MTIKNRQTDYSVWRLLGLRKKRVNQAAQQSRPEVWLAAAAALVMVAKQFTLIMEGMVAKSSAFVNG